MDDDDELPPQLVVADSATNLATTNISKEAPQTTVAVPAADSHAAAAPQAAAPAPSPIPLTILTGWLGSGKTTLLRFLLRELGNKGVTIAIVQNEASPLAAEGVEDALRLTDDSGTFGELLV